VRRINKSFSQTQVDITLEQTVNADAATRLIGITSFSQSDSARQRWMVTRAARSCIVGSLLDKAGLKLKEDVSKSLKPYRVTRDNNDLSKLLDAIKNTMNPFDQNTNETLHCITTGASVPNDIKEDLLGFQVKGQELCDNFTAESFNDQARFEKPISRRKIIEKVFQYPLTPIPLALAHVDGSINKTDKSKLLHKLEGMVESEKPGDIDVTLVDAMFLLHTLLNLPPTFGGVAEVILRRLCEMSPRTDLVCDTYITPSIKEAERNRRGSEEMTFAVTGPEQKRPQNWQTALQSCSFKAGFLRFLANEWKNNRYASILKDHIVVMGLDGVCYTFRENGGSVFREDTEALNCQHEETDTRLVFHLDHIMQVSPAATMRVRSNDTDVLVVLLCYAGAAHDCPNVWMDVGLSSNNTRRYISIPKLVDELESTVLQALPGLHAFTGTDFTASFMNKGKQRPLDIMMKHEQFISAFAMLGEHHNVPDETVSTIEHFVCSLYGKHNLLSVDTARYVMFQHTYAPRQLGDPLEKIKGVNPSSMPPCRSVLIKKIKRANYVASLWKKAARQDPSSLCGQPCQHGWILVDGSYAIDWFDGDQMPRHISQILSEKESVIESEDDEDVEMSHGELLYGSDESDVDDDDWR